MNEKLLNAAAGLKMVDGDRELYRILLEAYLAENKFEKSILLGFISKKDFLSAAKYIHRLKGASFQIGAEEIGSQAQKLEDIFRKKTGCSAGELAALTEKFCSDYDNVILIVKNLLTKNL